MASDCSIASWASALAPTRQAPYTMLWRARTVRRCARIFLLFMASFCSPGANAPPSSQRLSHEQCERCAMHEICQRRGSQEKWLREVNEPDLDGPTSLRPRRVRVEVDDRLRRHGGNLRAQVRLARGFVAGIATFHRA